MAKRATKVSNLRVGVYIDVPLPWMNHPFLTGSFKITSESQIKILRKLGVEELSYYPDKSDIQPVDESEERSDSPETTPEADDEAEEALWAEKKRQVEQQRKRRNAIVDADKQYRDTSRNVRRIMQESVQSTASAVEKAKDHTHAVIALLSNEDAALYVVGASRSDAPYNHALNVAMLALLFGKRLGFSDENLEVLGLAALMHDVGKVTLPDDVREKPVAQLNPFELRLYQQHVDNGIRLLKRDPAFPKAAILAILQHHEHVDGSGYPKGLTGDKISGYAKIIAICNTYDNLVNSLTARNVVTPSDALSNLYKNFTDKLDAKLVQTFVKTVGVYPPGSLVQLNNKARGVVTSINPQSLLLPNVLLYNPHIPKKDCVIRCLSDEEGLRVDRTLKWEELSEAAKEYLDIGEATGFQIRAKT